MSLISDALKKAEHQRAQPSLNQVSNWDQSSHARAANTPAASVPRTSSRGLLWINASVLALICAIAIYFWRDQPLAEDAAAPLATQDHIESVDIDATDLPDAPISDTIDSTQSARLAATSPFLPPAAQTVTEPAVTDEYDLAGTSSLGSQTLLSVVRRSDRRSIWIPVGKTVSEVTAVSYDPEKDQAVIRVRGNLLSVSMRQFADNPEPSAEAAE